MFCCGLCTTCILTEHASHQQQVHVSFVQIMCKQAIGPDINLMLLHAADNVQSFAKSCESF